MTIKWFKESQDIDLPLAYGNMRFPFQVLLERGHHYEFGNQVVERSPESLLVMYVLPLFK